MSKVKKSSYTYKMLLGLRQFARFEFAKNSVDGKHPHVIVECLRKIFPNRLIQSLRLHVNVKLI